jgi:hypothetical protein
VEQSREPTNRNRIQGGVAWGERASDREAPSAKEPSRRSGGCAAKVTEPYLGRSRFMPERATRRSAEREVSRGRSSQRDTADASMSALMKGRTEGRAKPL